MFTIETKTTKYYVTFQTKYNTANKPNRPKAKTICNISTEKDGKPIVSTVATCKQEDTFNRSKGRVIALSKALKELGLPREIRTMFYQVYFYLSPKSKIH